MQFRWLIFLTLWTVFSGPVLAGSRMVRDRAATADDSNSKLPSATATEAFGR